MEEAHVGRLKLLSERISFPKYMNGEWQSISETPLPRNIYAWQYKDRPDLMRAVVIGKSGTPFQHALFTFDFHIDKHFLLVCKRFHFMFTQHFVAYLECVEFY